MKKSKLSQNLKPKNCRQCDNSFNPFTSTQKVCCAACAQKYVKAEKIKKAEKEFNRETRRLKTKVKTRSQWLKETQTAFNAFIRERDSNLPCVSCNRHHVGQYHAGHYKTVGANPELRFDERNCHKQCAPCNNHLSGNITNYRVNLNNKIGAQELERLEGPHKEKKYTIQELKELKKHYKTKLKQLNEGTT